jgi:transposase
VKFTEQGEQGSHHDRDRDNVPRRGDRGGQATDVPVEYKRRIVKEADACKGPGDIGALLRREGLYSSQLANWRAARERGELAAGAATKKRGPKATPVDTRDKKIAEQAREIAKLTMRAERAEAIGEI